MLKKIISISLNFYKIPYSQWHKQNEYRELPIGQLLFGIPIIPLPDGNGRMSRLLTTLLLYRSGFYVGKYNSLEAKIARNKDLYYDALGRAQEGWHEGTEDAVPFIKGALRKLVKAGELKREGSGKGTYYVRLK